MLLPKTPARTCAAHWGQLSKVTFRFEEQHQAQRVEAQKQRQLYPPIWLSATISQMALGLKALTHASMAT
jgi:hypothetical protein